MADQQPKMVNVKVHNKTHSPITIYTGQSRRHSVSLAPGKRTFTEMSEDFFKAYRVRNPTGIVVTEAEEPTRQKQSTSQPTSEADSVEKLLAEVDAESVNFPQLRSRAKALLGDDFPAGTSPKKDDLVELLMRRQARDVGQQTS